VSDLTSHVETRIAEKELFRDGQRILAAVSGGVDSMVLLDLLHRLSKRHLWKLTVAHFNHRLRGAKSDADERLARRIARSLKLPFVAGRGDVRGFARQSGLSLEMAGRKLRHDFLAGISAKLKIPTVALAHHADDQVELFFLRLLRGAGGEGLAGMKWISASPSAPKIRLVRPLLDLSKAALISFAIENKIAFSEDSSNASIDIKRNRIRHELIPLLTRHYQPALGRSVLRLMEVVGTEAEFVARAAKEWLEGDRTRDFEHLQVAVQRRLIHQQLIEREISPDFDLVERLRLGSGQRIVVSGDCSVFRDSAGLVHSQKLEPVQFSSQKRQLLLSKEHGLTFGGLRIHWQIAVDNGTGNACKYDHVEYFDADKVGAPIWLRCWQPGDRFQPIGTGSARKLQDLFTNLKVPRDERRRRVVAATAHGELFWVEGLRMAEKFKLDENTVRKLEWSWHRYQGLKLS
jgi:tRNA(Ile)-lysidine synthase